MSRLAPASQLAGGRLPECALASRNFWGGFHVTKLSLPLASQREAVAGGWSGQFSSLSTESPTSETRGGLNPGSVESITKKGEALWPPLFLLILSYVQASPDVKPNRLGIIRSNQLDPLPVLSG